jgi:DNA-binding CsgD family transcriptional regulator
LEPREVERRATAAYLTGRDAESAELWSGAHRQFLGIADHESAARCAFWLAFQLLNAGEAALANGWIVRAERALDEHGADSVIRGFLLVPRAVRCIIDGNASAALDLFRQAVKIGERFGDRDLMALAGHGCGRALIRLGQITEGVGLLDEAMVAIVAGEISPVLTGDIYCSVLEACHEIFDWTRAQEWTSALSQWCRSQPDLVPYRGQCLVRRAEMLQLRGAWEDAIDEADRACEHLAAFRQSALGAAFYQRAELHRLRGEFPQAERGYRRASDAGRNAQPGLALLRLAEGKVDAATAAIGNALDGARSQRGRATMLIAYVEVMLVAARVSDARVGAEQLSEIANVVSAPFLIAAAAHAAGAVLLAENNPRDARTRLGDAWTTWNQIGAAYEGARTRVLLGLSCRQLGDAEGAQLEFEAARHIFDRLRAATDLAHLETCRHATLPGNASGLTARELEVLRLLATGKTNRMIADSLRISEKTVIRHVSNIFNKLDVPTRAAATAYAHQHRLV